MKEIKLTDEIIVDLEKRKEEAFKKGNMHELRVLMDKIWEHKQVLLNDMREAGLLNA